jgi:hypothetical protein
MALTANPVTYTAVGGSKAMSVPVGAQLNGSPTTPDTYTLVTPPLYGVAVASASGITYQPTDGTTQTADSFTYTVTQGVNTSAPATVTVAITASYNCACDTDYPTATLAQLQRRVLVRLGKAAMATPGPGMAELINDFLQSAQAFLYQKYRPVFLKRWFTWQMQPGQRFYDFGANIDACAKVLDPNRILWVGVSQGDANWRPLIEGIAPQNYTPKTTGLPSLYLLGPCLEVWPAAQDTSWLIRVYGEFGLLPFVADTDVTSVDAECVFLHALANAKAHYGKGDAGNDMAACLERVGMLNAASFPTKRAWPGAAQIPNAIPPKMVAQ